MRQSDGSLTFMYKATSKIRFVILLGRGGGFTKNAAVTFSVPKFIYVLLLNILWHNENTQIVYTCVYKQMKQVLQYKLLTKSITHLIIVYFIILPYMVLLITLINLIVASIRICCNYSRKKKKERLMLSSNFFLLA